MSVDAGFAYLNEIDGTGFATRTDLDMRTPCAKALNETTADDGKPKTSLKHISPLVNYMQRGIKQSTVLV